MLKDIIYKIRSLQSTGSDLYHEGLFPSQRVHGITGYCREDNNIFFSALIVFTLQRLQTFIPSGLQPEISQIIDKVVSNYHRYRHYADASTYNFWQNHPAGHFPHGWLLKRISFFALPADTDDTSLIYLTLPQKNDPIHIKEKLQKHYAQGTAVSPLTLPAYTDLCAYPTFLGKKMKRELDVCVICNVLHLVFENQLPLSKTDFDSIEYIRRVLLRRDFRTLAFYISPNYGNSGVILYHIARLVGSFNRTELSDLEALLATCLKEQLRDTDSFMEMLLIKISLLRLGLVTPPLADPSDWYAEFSNFYFFQAGMLSGFQKASLNRLASRPFFHLKYRCEAYYWTLWLEYKVLLAQSNSPKADFKSSSVDLN